MTMKQALAAKEIRKLRARDVRVRRVTPAVGPAAPRWEALGTVLLASPQGTVRVIIRSEQKAVRRLPEAWKAGLMRAQADLQAGRV